MFWPAPAARLQDSKHFQLIIEMPDTNPPRYLHTAIAIASIATAFTLYATSIIDILPAATIVVAIMLLTGCMSPDQARRSIRWVSGCSWLEGSRLCACWLPAASLGPRSPYSGVFPPHWLPPAGCCRTCT